MARPDCPSHPSCPACLLDPGLEIAVALCDELGPDDMEALGFAIGYLAALGED